ncbi:recombinase family protein (plasmid) [Hymenobacter tibetensis]|uniref:Recombinase family protein n=1 Tax=Hymenobacter tibetensis TaxID=497967 RepID=A0ABY4D6J8_9BACT|nr:recombinase family protein [Hymenobacter tibetensis]UOG77649.1 recombinase family protein [Hymenobacter tibetensis]
MPNYIAYYRVSTNRQGQSGLGLNAQEAAVRTFLSGDEQILAEFTEIESGRKNTRPQLAAAMQVAKETGAVLLVAKLDRLARNLAFLTALMESRVRFKAVDMPAADEFTIHVLGAVAEKEAKAISTRTKDALAAKKARGFQLGTPANLTVEARVKGQQQRQLNAQASLANRQAAELARLYRSQQWDYRRIAAKLTASGYRTRRGCHFTAAGVRRLVLGLSVAPAVTALSL